MKFGLLYELQLPRPWDNRARHRIIHEALTEIEIAAQLGSTASGRTSTISWRRIHFPPPRRSSSPPPPRARQIHIGHAVVLSPPGYNPPARVAERIATLDLIISERMEWGTGACSPIRTPASAR